MHFVINYGCYGHTEENWFPWLKKELESLGHSVTIPPLPSPNGHNLSNYMKLFPDYVTELDRNSVLIGHSLGCAFTLRLLEASGAEIAGAFLVSGFIHELGSEQFDPIIRSFVSSPFDFDLIRSKAHVFRVYHGDGDPYVPYKSGEQLAKELDVELQVIPHGGHLNEEAGFLKFPKLLKDLLEIC